MPLALPSMLSSAPVAIMWTFCLIDTAGRLQNREDLMQQLRKVMRVISKQG